MNPKDGLGRKESATSLHPSCYILLHSEILMLNKFESNNDAATSSFVSSFNCLAPSFVLIVNLFCSFICMVVYL